MLPLLLLFLLLVPPGLAFDANILVHQSDILKIKCDALPMRTIYSEGTCYYTYTEKFTSVEGLQKCQSVFSDATLFTDKTPILEQLGGKESDFHDSSDCATPKRALCAYELGSKCEGDETLIINSYCVHVSEDRNYNDGLKYCRSRGSSFPTVENNDHNLLIAGELNKKRLRSGWLLQKTEKVGAAMKWAFPESKELMRHFAPIGSAVALACRVPEGMLIHSLSRQCSTFGVWNFYDLARKNTTLCIRSADSDFNPVVRNVSNTPGDGGTKPEIPDITGKGDGLPPNSVLVPLKYFYNAAHIRHAFCATSACVGYINKKDIGFSPTAKKAGSLGRIVYHWSNGLTETAKTCPVGVKDLVQLHFKKNGKRYQADFASGHVGQQGWVALKQGVCGANVPIREYSCSMSQDFMYGQNLEWNTWYKGRVRHGNKPLFWIWK